MAKTQFSGPIRTGKTTGIPGQDTVGTLVAFQEVTVAAGDMKKQLQFPANCEPINFNILVTGSAGQVPGVNIRLGTSADATFYASVPVSAIGIYPLTRAMVSAQSMKAGFGASDYNILAIDATAQASAAALVGFEALVGVTYIQRS